MADFQDLERVRRALRAGAQAVQVEMRDAATRRALHPAVIAYEADGGVLELAKHGRVTRLGRLWDQERERANRSRSPVRSQTEGASLLCSKNARQHGQTLPRLQCL